MLLSFRLSSFQVTKNRNGWLEGIDFLEKTTSCACLVGSCLNNIFHWHAQSSILTKLLFRLWTETVVSVTTEKSVVSFANNVTSLVIPCGRSLM